MTEEGDGPRTRRYYFGLYHWRERGRRLLLGVAAVLWGIAVGIRSRSRIPKAVGIVSVLWGANRVRTALLALLSPPPWVLDGEKYEALGRALPLSESDRLLDVGSGTGRSLVGMAPAVPDDCSVLAIDVFDDRIILGNGPRLARRNARIAGVDVEPVRGDGTRLPVSEGVIDTVTLCRVLHDLPKGGARRALEEAHRVCRPDGTVGVLALPFPHEPDADPTAYWRELVADAGFAVDTVIEREDGYTIIVGDAGGTDG
jgi:SAM-dependent methyltransferase